MPNTGSDGSAVSQTITRPRRANSPLGRKSWSWAANLSPSPLKVTSTWFHGVYSTPQLAGKPPGWRADSVPVDTS